MQPIGKIITAILTSLYAAAAILFVYCLVRRLGLPFLPDNPWFWGFFPMLGFGLLVFYCNHLAENEDIGRFSRILWFIRFFILGFIAFPIYWIAFIMRSEVVEDVSEEE